ncbi:bifunctional hydroxymethylpyrimidine kinase/phosphomethylpyrimidine kinase [Paenibacillus sp.]|uniref:bifunctional hydroxymethylpyrimidine kinase/phosphomethylpyrimidine kinase n=1 Tax=Paenibacillus sp. TaxID=58172 RepID=UPI002810E592|nr:bifunctional hydroxymethylpyrimidine kinase/phosphomethylpyrimidine kinase [Paenibacillus sp.]
MTEGSGGRAAPPRALTIAGSDSGGGAGMQGDLKTFQELGVYGMSVVTAITAQNSLGVQRIEPVAPELIEAQLDSVLGDIGADAVKTGMLPTPEAVAAAAAAIRRYGLRRLVVDPVRTAKDGRRLLSGEAFEALAELLLPLAELATPNVPEAAALLGVTERDIRTPEERIDAAKALLSFGSRHVLLKGGHAEGDDCLDILVAAGDGGRRPVLLSGPRLARRHTHGTGCALSSAVCAALAGGATTEAACRRAKAFVAAAIAGSYPTGAGVGSLRHEAWRAGAP